MDQRLFWIDFWGLPEYLSEGIIGGCLVRQAVIEIAEEH